MFALLEGDRTTSGMTSDWMANKPKEYQPVL